VGKVTAVPEFSTTARLRNQRNGRHQVQAGSPDQEQEEDEDDDGDDEGKSPMKIRKVVRNNSKGVDKGIIAVNKKTKAKSRITLHRRSKSTHDDEDVEDDEGDDLMVHDEDEEGNSEGLIELDGEEEAAFANLGKYDASLMISYMRYMK